MFVMAPFSIPVPHIVPLQIALLGGPKSIDTNTKIQLVCETYLHHEIFYTIDGTKPQPYAGIVQGNRTIKYSSPFCLPAGKITIKALAVNSNIHTMRSNIVTKCFDVKGDSVPSPKKKLVKKMKKRHEYHNESKIKDSKQDKSSDHVDNGLKSNPFTGTNHDCFEEAFIASTDIEIVSNNNDSDIEDGIESSYNSDISETQVGHEAIAEIPDENEEEEYANRSALEEYLHSDDDINMVLQDAGLPNSAKIQPLCCQKCDTSLQQCFSCKRINIVSSKFCVECGAQLAQVCGYCKGHNPCFAVYCQSCGKKIDHTSNIQSEICLKADHSATAKPQLKAVGIQKVPLMLDKCTQTVREAVLKTSPRINKNRLPRHSPGRGYWHQQMDYICNHLKSHAYNNLDFRKAISDPILCDFQSAHIDKDENQVIVTMIFSQLTLDKDTVSSSECNVVDKT